MNKYYSKKGTKMKIAILKNYQKLGKLHGNGAHFASGVVKHKSFGSINDLGDILKKVAKAPDKCVSIGNFKHNGKVLPSHRVVGKMDMSRTKADMISGNILVVDNDTQKKYDISIFAKYWKSAFKGAGYVTTKSGSTLLGKKKNGTHTYFIVNGDYNDIKHTMEIMEAICIVEGYYQVEFQATGRAVVKTPIDLKLCEVQMPVYEDDVNPKVVNGSTLNLSKRPKNYDNLMKKASLIKKDALNAVSDESLNIHKSWLKKTQGVVGLDKTELRLSFSNHERRYVNENTKLVRGGKVVGVVGDLLTGKLQETLFADIFEPEYGGGSQKTRYYNYMFHSQAHGGINYYIRVSEKWARDNRKLLKGDKIAVETDNIQDLSNELGIKKLRSYPKQVVDTKDVDEMIVGAYRQVKGLNIWDGSILQYDMLEKIIKNVKVIDGVLSVLPSLTHEYMVGTPNDLSKRLATTYPILQDTLMNGELTPVDIKGTVSVIKTALEMCNTVDNSKLNHLVKHTLDDRGDISIHGTALVKTLPINKPMLVDTPKKPKRYNEILGYLKKTAIGNAETILKYSLACKVLPHKKQFMIDSSVSNSMKSTLVMALSDIGLLKEVKPESLLKSDTNKTAPDQFPKYWMLAFDDTVKIFRDSYYEIKNKMPFAMAYSRSTINVAVPAILVSTADGLKGLSEQRQNRTFDLDIKEAWSGTQFTSGDIQSSVMLYLYNLATNIYDDIKSDPINVANDWITNIHKKYSKKTISANTKIRDALGEALCEIDDYSEIKAIRDVVGGYIRVNKSATPSSMLEELYMLSGNKLESKSAMYEFNNVSWEDIGCVVAKKNSLRGMFMLHENGKICKLKAKNKDSKPVRVD